MSDIQTVINFKQLVTLMNVYTAIATATLTFEVAFISCLIALPGMGKLGKTISEACTRAPGLDFVVLMLVPTPWLIGSWIAGWLGLVAILIGQITAMQLWIFWHEKTHSEATSGSRIVHFLNKEIGWWRNHLGLWVSTLALPMFLSIRLSEITIYPLLVWILGFPYYNTGEWVNVSRHKFEGLVGHDLVWCWYCDWMTGVYSLGAEMLRNVESFWCPIRFYDGKKCENCKLDFPDLENGWVAADKQMDDVVELMANKHGGRFHSWFGHPERQEER